MWSQNRLCLSEEIRYQIFQSAQRTHAQSVLPEHVCEATLCWRQSVSPTHNDHLSLAQINGDDRWGVLAVLTEALRQASRKDRGYGAWSWPRGAKAPLLILSPCWVWDDPSLDRWDGCALVFLRSPISPFSDCCICLEHSPHVCAPVPVCVINSLWIIHFPKRLVGYSKHVIWSWCKTRRYNRQRIDRAKSASTHLRAWHPNNQTKPVWIHWMESGGLDMIWWSPFHTCWERWTVQGPLKSLGFLDVSTRGFSTHVTLNTEG